jgi:hypothetical protein
MSVLRKAAAAASRVVHGAEHHRAYTYRVASTIGGLLVAGGVIDGTREGYLIALVGAVLGLPNGLAAANTSTRKRPSP